MKRDYFYVWVIPLLWCGFTIVSSFHTGDEHGLFILGSIAGTWPFMLLPLFDPLEEGLVFVLVAGSVTLAGPGLLLDLLRVRMRVWFVLFGVLAVLFFVLQYIDYGSFQRMRYLHRYIGGVVVVMCNLSIYVTTILCIAGGFLRFVVRCMRAKKVGSNSEVSADE